MKRLWLLIGVALLGAVLAVGAVACDDDDDAGNGAEPTATAPVDGGAPTATEPADGAEPTATEQVSDGGGFTTVVVTENAELGAILTTFDGYTVYQFANDESGVSNCGEGCVDLWPPLPTAGEPTGGEGVTGELGTITRDDGTTQVTYNGLPLYLYANDPAPGDTNGNGFAGLWSVVNIE